MLRHLLPLLASALFASAVQAGAYDDILAAADGNRVEVVDSLLQLGLDPNTASPEGTTLLMMAARHGHMGLLDLLLSRRANHLIRNKYGDTALMLAALNGRLDVVSRLIELPGPQENRDGWTPLHYAAFGGHVAVARFIMTRKTTIDLPAPNSQTALMLAASAGHLPMVKFLLDEEADPRLRDRTGMTAREIAKAKGHQLVVDYLNLFEPAK